MNTENGKNQKALDKLRQICSRQEKCPADIVSLLERWGVEPEEHKAVIEQLKSEKFIDEQRYASSFARDKIKFDHWGLIKIRLMLLRKGINKNIAETVIREIDRNEYRKMIGLELSKKT